MGQVGDFVERFPGHERLAFHGVLDNHMAGDRRAEQQLRRSAVPRCSSARISSSPDLATAPAGAGRIPAGVGRVLLLAGGVVRQLLQVSPGEEVFVLGR